MSLATFRLLVSAGGTGGGVYPALAVVRALGDRADVLWIGGEAGMEATLVPRARVRFEAIPAAGLHGVGLARLPHNAARLIRGLAAARKLVRRFRPDVLLLTGGYIGVPVALAAGRVPSLVVVPDLEPGLALRFMIRRARAVALTGEHTRRWIPRRTRAVVSGYPTRPELQPVPRREARRRLGLTASRPVLLVMGGSRGARSVNEAVWSGLGALLERAQVIHLTGELDWPRVADVVAALPARLAGRYHPRAYLHEELAWAFSAADLAVSRSGASVLGEYPLFGLPSVLVPYPHAWRYQRVNAAYLAERGAAVVVEDRDLRSALIPTALELLGDPARRAEMSRAAHGLARPQAAQAIAHELQALADQGGGHG